MKTSVKIHCKCTEGAAARFQDREHGKQVRVANVTNKGDNKNRDVRCTVCGAVQRVNVE